MFIWITLAIFAAGGIFKILLKYRTWSEYYKIQIICLLGMAIFGVVFMFVSSKNAQMIMATIIKLFSCVLILVTNILLLNVYSF
jgi:preprotein translocase subunit Sss1